MHGIYNLGIFLYTGFIHLLSPFHRKAALWTQGRKNLLAHLSSWRQNHPGRVYWFHCASLGEFEQGRPLIEEIKKKDTECRILLTFFSPSGYEVRKNYSGADYISYLPADFPSHSRRFVKIIRPSAAFIVKYEYWANYFFSCKKNNIPLFIVSGVIRPDQRFFGIFSGFWKKVLSCVTHFFIQNEQTAVLLEKNCFTNFTLSGDTRFDRVHQLALSAGEIEDIKTFLGASKCIVCGSTWPSDEKHIAVWYDGRANTHDVKLIIAPHNITDETIRSVQLLFPGSVLWSNQRQRTPAHSRVLILDTIGILNIVYRYADIAFVGGGFDRGIHNVLEPAVWGVPVVFGPVAEKFEEAMSLVKNGGAFQVHSESELKETFNRLLEFPEIKKEAGFRAKEFVNSGLNATSRILEVLGNYSIPVKK